MADQRIDCVDSMGQDENGHYRRLILPDAIRINTIGQMVSAILGRLGQGDRIQRLRVFGHGCPGYQGLGNSERASSDWYHSISMHYWRQQSPVLSRLCGHFAPDGWVELSGCHVGQGSAGQALLLHLAQLWGVEVAAGVEYQSPDPGLEGPVPVAFPDGTVRFSVNHKLSIGLDPPRY